MISHIDITGIHYEVSDDLKKYVEKRSQNLISLFPDTLVKPLKLMFA